MSNTHHASGLSAGAGQSRPHPSGSASSQPAPVYELHPLCTLFPRLSGSQFDALKRDIAAHGMRQPIVLYQGAILDGGNRYRACLDTGTAPRFIELDGTGAAAYVLSANLHRRHLSPGQQAAIVASAQDWSRAQRSGGDRTAGQGARLHLDTVAERAARAGASIRTQKMADKVARAAPELAKMVGRGELSLPAAHERLAAPPSPSQPVSGGAAAHPARPELLIELEAADKEIRRLGALVRELSTSDLAQQVAAWSLRFDQLSGRLAQLNATCNDADSKARRYARLLERVRALLGVDANAAIVPAIASLKEAAHARH
ncbi:ParB/RepB/Spo0J family partition protein [Massilia aquatica]|uniref:S-adenosylmethionine-binding protein n=1 Tax=Massilia aquatica TaxID=2609000 RepID=A0ABX0M5G1_9BURK|nr:S-adenosylmethionine-binding protein [Massilia aquatica]NHZ41828.1 S-adenosylmethionine-binding protein [Massilia aquatica]